VFENRVLRRVFEPKRDEVAGVWRKLHNEELRNLYSSNIITMMRWAGHVARMGRKGMHIRYWWESQTERDHYEDQDAGEWTILKWILERQDGVVWSASMWLRIGTSEHGNESSSSIKWWEVFEQLHN
jgi:hypothetical protein